MSLGNFGMADFKPKRSGTAATLLSARPDAREDDKKTERFQLRLRSDMLMLFKEICEKNHSDPSKAIRMFISSVISSGSLTVTSAENHLSAQNVRTNTPILKEANAFSGYGKLNLKNKNERIEWLNDFRKWGVWLDIPELQMKYYRYDFINGSSLIISYGKYYYEGYKEIKTGEDIRYSLLDDKRSGFDCCGISFTYVLEWLTRHSKEI